MLVLWLWIYQEVSTVIPLDLSIINLGAYTVLLELICMLMNYLSTIIVRIIFAEALNRVWLLFKCFKSLLFRKQYTDL